MSWQPASCDTVRVEETIKTSIVKLCGDLSCLQELLMAMPNRGGRRLRLLAWEDFQPATHRRRGQIPLRGDQSIGGQGYNHPMAEQEGRAPAGGMTGYVSSAFT
jgi:hypothetical protein